MFVVDDRQARLSVAVLAACCAHAAALVLALWLARSDEVVASIDLDGRLDADSGLVWVAAPGPGGGGGGGGNEMPQPPRQAARPGADQLTVAATPPAAASAPATIDPPPALDAFEISAVPLASGIGSLPGAVDAPQLSTAPLSRGPGRDGGAGTGMGSGDGPGQDSSLGPGRGGNTGNGAFQAGSGVSEPVPIFIAEPRFTSAAMQARLQGDVVVECIVQPDGNCNPMRVVRSLDTRFGLDEEALRAAGRIH